MGIVDYDNKEQTFIKSLCSEIQICMANFVFNTNGLKIVFGDRNNTIVGRFKTYYSNPTIKDSWSVRVHGIAINNNQITIVQEESLALIDPSFEPIQVPSTVFEKIIIEVHKYGCMKYGRYIECTNHTTINDIQLDFGVFKINLDAVDILHGAVGNMRRLAVVESLSNDWVIGWVVLKKGYLGMRYSNTPQLIFTPFDDTYGIGSYVSLAVTIVCFVMMIGSLGSVYYKSAHSS